MAHASLCVCLLHARPTTMQPNLTRAVQLLESYLNFVLTCCVSAVCLLQAVELQAACAAAEEAAVHASSLTQLVSGLQADKASLAAQVKKLTAEKASLSEQLGSSAGDIDMLQVCVGLADP